MYDTQYRDLSDEQMSCMFHSRFWNGFPADIKLAACQEMHNRFADEHHMQRCLVKVAPMEGTLYGYFDGVGSIYVNQSVLENGVTVNADGTLRTAPGSNAETLNTLFHESSHAYDHQLSEAVLVAQDGKTVNVEIIKDAQDRGLDIDLVRASDAVYIPGVPGNGAWDDDLYRVQDCEKRAFQTGEDETAAFMEKACKKLGPDPEYNAYAVNLQHNNSYEKAFGNLKTIYGIDNVEQVLNEETKAFYYGEPSRLSSMSTAETSAEKSDEEIAGERINAKLSKTVAGQSLAFNASNRAQHFSSKIGESYSNSHETVPQPHKGEPPEAPALYDWENQTTFSQKESGLEKSRGGSEIETKDLRDLPMSSQDCDQYRSYFNWLKANYRDTEESHKSIESMGKSLSAMELSLWKGQLAEELSHDPKHDQEKLVQMYQEASETYTSARERFLDTDWERRSQERAQNNDHADRSNDHDGHWPPHPSGSSGSLHKARIVSDDSETHTNSTNEASELRETTPSTEEQGSDTPQQLEDDLQSARSRAVKQAWEKEAERVRNGRGTWDWTVEQQAELLERGAVSGFEGSHMLSAKDYPEQAGNPDNIQLIPAIAHFDGVHGRNPHENVPSGIYDPNTGEIIPITDGKVPEIPEFDLTDRYDPEQQEFHDAHPDFEQSGKGRRQGFKDTKDRHPEKSINKRSAIAEEIGKKSESGREEISAEESTEKSVVRGNHTVSATNEEATPEASRESEHDIDYDSIAEDAGKGNERDTITSAEETASESRELRHKMAPAPVAEKAMAESREPEQNMSPALAVEEVAAESREPEQNMAPAPAVEEAASESREPEQNMAPAPVAEKAASESREPEQNMVPASEVEEAASESREPEHDMTPGSNEAHAEPSPSSDIAGKSAAPSESQKQDYSMSL